MREVVILVTLMISFSKHAAEKVKERKISEVTLRTVLEGPEARFYDISSGAEVAYKKVTSMV